MKAIDFACRLVRAMLHEKMRQDQLILLMGVSAGLETCQDLAIFYGFTAQQVASNLGAMEKKGYLGRDKSQTPHIYSLSETGRGKLYSVMSFLPKSHE